MTAGQETYQLPEPFFVIATQNPIEQEGTYPLPEAQLDRFMFNIKVDYPTLDEEKRILAMATQDEAPELTKVLSGKADREHAEADPQRAGRRLRAGTTSRGWCGRRGRATRRRRSSSARWWIGAPARGPASS